MIAKIHPQDTYQRREPMKMLYELNRRASNINKITIENIPDHFFLINRKVKTENRTVVDIHKASDESFAGED